MSDHALWIEKYRPLTLAEFEGQEIIKQRVAAMIQQKSIPHLLFAGPAGVGKSTLALIIARELFGESWRENFLELNASVTPETPIMIRREGVVRRVTFGELAAESFMDATAKYEDLSGVEILSIDKDHKVGFKKAENISRHTVGSVLDIKYEGGSVKTSLNHSIMVVDESGEIVSKRADQLKEGDLLITFRAELEGSETVLNFEHYPVSEYSELVSGMVKNPKIQTVLGNQMLTSDTSWLFGLYVAEGCPSFNKKESSGQTIFTVGYPQEEAVAKRAIKILKTSFGINPYVTLGSSGFNRNNLSSKQVRACNTQLTRFMRDNFYSAGASRFYAHTKKFPDFIFSSELSLRLEFLKGYLGDACGEWDEFVRYSSRSKDALIDTTWLARISGLQSSCFAKHEARIMWKSANSSYEFSELIPAAPFMRFLESINPGYNFRYLLRHQYYGKKSKRLKKELALELLERVNVELSERQKNKMELLKKLARSDLYAVEIKSVKKEKYEGFVYDVSVPGAEMFWGGTAPILLHNSDARGIDVIRNEVKGFARTRSLSGEFKIIFLDECDALTREAQQALRRTMEMYASSTRFIMSCNYASKIIDPIMSRCTVFRFKPLEEASLMRVIDRVAAQENLKIDDAAKKALIKVSRGDVRKVQNVLQSCASVNKSIVEHTIFEMVSAAHPEEIREIVTLALKKDFINARSQLLKVMVSLGLSGFEVVKQIAEEVWSLKIPDAQKAQLIEFCGDAEFRMVEGADELLQLEALLARVVSL